MTVACIEQGSTAAGEDDLWVLVGFLTTELNVAVNHRILPDRLSRAVALPRVHRLAVSPRAARDPG